MTETLDFPVTITRRITNESVPIEEELGSRTEDLSEVPAPFDVPDFEAEYKIYEDGEVEVVSVGAIDE